MLRSDRLIDKYIQIKEADKLDYAQLRERLRKDRLQEYQINKIINEVYRRQQDTRVKYHNRLETIYPFVFGSILIGAGVYFYQIVGGFSLIQNANGIGWNEYRYSIGIIVLFAIGVSLILHGWVHLKK